MLDNLEQKLQNVQSRHFGTGASEEEIKHAQHELQVRFPIDYYTFLRKFGWGGAGYWEIYGLGADVPLFLDLVYVSQSERKEMVPKLPLTLIPICNDGGGNHYCLNIQKLFNERCPVVFWDHDLDENQELEEIAINFETWILTMVDSVTA